MSIRLNLLNKLLRTFERPALAKMPDVESGRARLLGQSKLFASTPGVYFAGTVLEYDGLAIDTVVAHPATTKSRAALLWLHGGAYVQGSAETHRKITARVAKMTGLTGFVIDYRLAPEHCFPAAHDDAVAAYRALIERGYNQIVIAGDSAGGGLTFALLHTICSEKLQMPTAVIAMSPWTDLTVSSGTITSNDLSEVMLPTERIREAAQEYLGGADANDPRATPINGNFDGAPPVLIQVSEKEVLFDDGLRMAERLESFGVDVTVQSWPDTYHVWQLMHDRIPEANEALENVRVFVEKQMAAAGTSPS